MRSADRVAEPLALLGLQREPPLETGLFLTLKQPHPGTGKPKQPSLCAFSARDSPWLLVWSAHVSS